MSQGDLIPHGPPPGDLATHEAAFGTRALRLDGRKGVRLMLKGFRILAAPDGEPVAYVDIQIPSAVQSIQSLRQAIADARRGQFR